MDSTNDSKLNIISMNVRGIRNVKKRRALFSQFRLGKYDVVGLQETHLNKKDIDMLKREWGTNFHISEGSNHSKGILTLFGKSIKIDEQFDF